MKAALSALSALPVLSVLCAIAPAAAADGSIVVDLWPGRAPGDNLTRYADRVPGEEEGPIKAEKFFEFIKRDGRPYQVAGRATKFVTNVTRPTITVHRPPRNRNTGVAMLVCPGGGYFNLLWDVEGEEVAAWLNSIGVTAIILKYRVPRRIGDARDVPAPGPLKDAQRAMRLVRSRAGEWGIDPRKIGMVGFSAGGHLAVATAMNCDTRAYQAIDDIDKISCRPDFAVSIYGGYLVGKDNETVSADMRVSNDTPPILLIHAGDDDVSPVENSVRLYLALKQAGAPAELHTYASGGHGFGVRKVGHPCEGWIDRCVDWLRDRAFLPPARGK